MILDTLVFDESQITCPTNGLHPKWGGQCHSLTREAGRTDVIIRRSEEMSYQEQTGSLLASGYSKLGTQEAANDMYVTEQRALCSSGEISPSLVASAYKGPGNTQDGMAISCFQNTGQGWWNESEIGATVRTPCGGDSTKANLTMTKAQSVVRRLTPMECERLQGFPDGWTDIGEWTDSKGKIHKESDTPRYKALGNSIAVGYANGQKGFWCWMAKRMCAQYDRPTTMASLFDGIGGFPLAFSAAGCTPVWASEIEEFPIAVTKIHFPKTGHEWEVE